tara:strand:- start:2202 stop:2507 length:306 start_codon:yes stop_codon:yes gene_type:complete
MSSLPDNFFSDDSHIAELICDILPGSLDKDHLEKCLNICNSCNCCKGHIFDRPKTIDGKCDSEITHPGDDGKILHNGVECTCPCRSNARWICRFANHRYPD